MLSTAVTVAHARRSLLLIVVGTATTAAVATGGATRMDLQYSFLDPVDDDCEDGARRPGGAYRAEKTILQYGKGKCGIIMQG